MSHIRQELDEELNLLALWVGKSAYGSTSERPSWCDSTQRDSLPTAGSSVLNVAECTSLCKNGCELTSDGLPCMYCNLQMEKHINWNQNHFKLWCLCFFHFRSHDACIWSIQQCLLRLNSLSFTLKPSIKNCYNFILNWKFDENDIFYLSVHKQLSVRVPRRSRYYPQYLPFQIFAFPKCPGQ